MTGSPSRRGVVGGALMLAGLSVMPVGAWAAEGQTPPLAVPLPAPPRPPVIVDAEGVMRWGPAGEEVAVFGVNYCLPSASAYRYARAAGADLDRTVIQDLDHLKRLGQDAIRLSFWGDYEVTERNGDLIENDHLRLLDRVVAEASARGMAMLLSPIVTYNANWPDALDQPVRGIGGAFEKGELGLNPAAIAAQVNYLTQLLSRPSALTGRRLADEPWLIAVEPVNEPWHHPE
ncbi:hypothetical protein, partial [Brevundimonas sp.]|uniref:hypothetical protein n=1 Tax=Brevundimonas sp. TaxID=1871086 RepID=UPI002AB85573